MILCIFAKSSLSYKVLSIEISHLWKMRILRVFLNNPRLNVYGILQPPLHYCISWITLINIHARRCLKINANEAIRWIWKILEKSLITWISLVRICGLVQLLFDQYAKFIYISYTHFPWVANIEINFHYLECIF